MADQKNNLINWLWPVFPHFSSFPSTFLYDNSDPLKKISIIFNCQSQAESIMHRYWIIWYNYCCTQSSGTKYLVPITWTNHMVPIIWYQSSGINNLLPIKWYQSSSTNQLVPLFKIWYFSCNLLVRSAKFCKIVQYFWILKIIVVIGLQFRKMEKTSKDDNDHTGNKGRTEKRTID